MQHAMKIINFEIPGEPVAKGTARVTRWGTYTPEKTVLYENWVKDCFIRAYGHGMELLEGPLKMNIVAYKSIPKSKSNKVKAAMAVGHIRPTNKPDSSNIAKAVEDALNGLAYKDDSQIVDQHINKYYAEIPRVEITIQEAI